MRALLSQGGDIAVEGAQADPQFAGEHMPGHRVTVPAQNLQQVEQALATGQGADSQLLQAVAGVVVEGDEDQQAIAVLRRRPPVGLLQFEFAAARMTEAL